MARQLLIDTNLLVVVVLGAVRPGHIERFNRTRQYSTDDYLLLLDIINDFDQLVVTPHVLAETSNLLGQLTEPLRATCLAYLASVLPDWKEEWRPASTLVNKVVYLRLGLTDTAAYQMAAEQVTVLTDDFDLYKATLEAGRSTINFSHRREESGHL